MTSTSEYLDTSVHRAMLKIGGVAGIAGGVIGLVANVTHPAADDLNDTLAQIQLVADSDNWILDHMAIMLGVMLVTVFVFALARTIKGGLASEVARLGYGFQLVAAATIVVLMGIDGLGSKHIFDEWAASSGAEREMWTPVAIAVEEIDFGAFTTFLITQYGVVFIALGAAIWLSDNYNSFFGIFALLLGIFGVIMGSTWAFAGRGELAVTFGFGTLLALLAWVVAAGVLMLRATPPQAPDDAPAPDQGLTASVD